MCHLSSKRLPLTLCFWFFPPGFGAFGNVHYATLRSWYDGQPEIAVAVKSLNENAEELDKNDFLAEIQVSPFSQLLAASAILRSHFPFFFSLSLFGLFFNPCISLSWLCP